MRLINEPARRLSLPAPKRETDQQQRHCRSRNPDRCAIGPSSRPRSTPLEKQLEREEREIYMYMYIYLHIYIYIYKEKSKGNTREWKLRTAMSISHQACCCSSFNIITRRGKRKRGLDIHIYVVRNLIVIVLHTFPHLSMMMIDPQGCPFFDACSFHLYPSVPSSRIRGNQFRDVTIFYYYYYYY